MMTRPVRRAVEVGILTCIITTLICALVVINNPERGALVFAHIGTRFSEGDPQGTVGYDGQFAYFIARDGAAAVPYIDGPSLRYQRILYPLVSRALALGQPEPLPWVMVGVNIAAHSIGAGLLAYLLAAWGAPAWGGLIYALWIGALFAVRFNLNEPLCFALGLAAVAAYRQERLRLTVLLLILSTMAKELGLVIAAGLAFHAFFQGRRGWALLLMAGPALTFLAWWGVMRLWFGTLPTRYPAARISPIPLSGMLSANSSVELALLALWLGMPTVALAGAATWDMLRRRQVALSAALALAGAGFVMFMPAVSWADPVAAYRVGLPVMVGGLLFAGECRPRWLPWLAALWLPGLLLILLLPQIWFGAMPG